MLTMVSLFVIWLVILCVLYGSRFVVSTSAISCLERLVHEMIYCVSSGTLNSDSLFTMLAFITSI